MKRNEGKQALASQLFIVELDLAEFSSHFFNQVLGFKQAAEERGLIPRVLLRKEVAAALADPLDALRLIELEPANAATFDHPLDSFAASDRQLRSLWNAIESMEVSSRDVVLITSSPPAVIYSLGVWLSRLAPERRPAVFIRFFNHEYLDLKKMDYGGQSWIHHLAAKDLLQRPGQARVFFTVNNEALIMPLAQLCARRVFQMPLPKYYGEIPEPRHAGAGAPVIYVHLNMRSGVMLDQVEPAIHTVLDQYPHAKFLLKYCKNALEPAADGRLSDALSARGVELVPSEQSHADHIRTIARSDIVFLPYEATEYTALASGVFAEATALGKVNVYPANTWMAEQVARGHAAGVGFAAANHRETSAAVVRALDSLTELSSLAVARSHAFRALHSCGRNLDLMLVLAAEEQDMSLRFIPGKPIRFDQPFQSRSHLGRGWSSFEPVGIWTDAAIAELNFYSGPRPAGAFDVHFSLTPFFSKGRPQQVTISVGGVELCRWDFPDHQERAASWRRVTVPLHLMTDGRIRMQLRVKDPHSPKQIGMSEDPRELGIMLHEMRLDYLESQMD